MDGSNARARTLVFSVCVRAFDDALLHSAHKRSLSTCWACVCVLCARVFTLRYVCAPLGSQWNKVCACPRRSESEQETRPIVYRCVYIAGQIKAGRIDKARGRKLGWVFYRIDRAIHCRSVLYYCGLERTQHTRKHAVPTQCG